MEQDKLSHIMEAYRRRAKMAEKAGLWDKANEMNDFADFIEDNFDAFHEEAYTRESELWEEYEAY